MVLFLTYFACGLPRTSAKIRFVVECALCDELTVLDEVDGVHTGDLLGVECAESQEGLAHHVCGQPVSVIVLDLIPEEFFLLSDTVNGLIQAAREEVREYPDDSVNFCINKREVIVVVFQFLVYPCPCIFCFLTCLVFAIDDLAVL